MIPHTLHGLDFVERFYTFSTIDSTNTFAQNLTEFPRKGFFVVQADMQTAGRGRMGNVFYSNVKGGLWISFVTPLTDIGDHFRYNRALSLALCSVLLDRFGGAPIGIKWPNDIYWGDRKICGILLETVPSRRDMLVIGMGLNCNIHRHDFPAELHPIATSTYIETGTTVSLGSLLRGICEAFHQYLEQTPEKAHLRYLELLYGTGRRVEIDGAQGIFAGVTREGALMLTIDTVVRQFHSGALRYLAY